MKLYQTPGGTWAGSEKDWKAAMKAEGSDSKAAVRKIVEVPVDKAGLMEFLTFHNVNVVNPQGIAPAPEVIGAVNSPQPPAAPMAPTIPDVEALRAQYNPESVVMLPAPSTAMADMGTQFPAPAAPNLDELFAAAPLRRQLDLAVNAIDRANAALPR